MYTNCSIKRPESSESKPKFVISYQLTDMMDLIKKKGVLGIRGPAILFVLISLLVSEASSEAEDASSLRIKLDLLRNSYRQLCNQYSNLASNCAAPAINCTECPDKWLHVGDQCFFLNTDKDSWSNSAKKCANIGGHLAILRNREEHNAVEKEARRIGAFDTYYWIGLTDAETEGHWKWVDNTTLTRTYWNLDKPEPEPDNNQSGGAEGEDCAVVNSYTQTWYDVPCSFLYPRICQKAADPLI